MNQTCSLPLPPCLAQMPCSDPFPRNAVKPRHPASPLRVTCNAELALKRRNTRRSGPPRSVRARRLKDENTWILRGPSWATHPPPARCSELRDRPALPGSLRLLPGRAQSRSGPLREPAHVPAAPLRSAQLSPARGACARPPPPAGACVPPASCCGPAGAAAPPRCVGAGARPRDRPRGRCGDARVTVSCGRLVTPSQPRGAGRGGRAVSARPGPGGWGGAERAGGCALPLRGSAPRRCLLPRAAPRGEAPVFACVWGRYACVRAWVAGERVWKVARCWVFLVYIPLLRNWCIAKAVMWSWSIASWGISEPGKMYWGRCYSLLK